MRPTPFLLILWAFGAIFSACAAPPSAASEPANPSRALEQATASVVSLVVEGADGDAFSAAVVLDNAGHLVTVHHAVENAAEITVLIAGGYTVRADLVAADPVVDLALLKCRQTNPAMKPAVFATVEPGIGDEVWSIGNPFGLSRIGGVPSVGRGVVSGLHRSYLNRETGRFYPDALQHDAPTNPGNSGGGVFNARGELIGVNALITTMREQAGNSGVAFALPAHYVRRVMDKLKAGGMLEHGWFGELEYKQAAEVSGSGGRLRAVFGPLALGGPAMDAGLAPGDVLLKVAGEDIYGIHQALMVEDASKPGAIVKLLVSRAGRQMEIELQVADRTREE